MAIKQLYPDIRPSLLLDFANSGTVDSRITFNRSSRATYFDKTGILKTAEVDKPRIDYDPVTGVCKGLLIEESRTNLLTYSEQFNNNAWSKTFSTISMNAAVAPDGTMTADKLIENSGTVIPYISINPVISVTQGSYYTFTLYAKEDLTSVKRYLTLLFPYSVFGTNVRATFNLGDGTSTQFNSPFSVSIIPVGNGWYRCSITALAVVTTSLSQLQIRLFNSPIDTLGDYTGDGTSGIYIWGAQLEAGSFPTSYIPSTETFISRASQGTYYGSDGLLKTAGNNVARYNYNPNNLSAPAKLLLEPERTNLLTYSEQFINVAWSGTTTCTFVANSTNAPNGTLTAYKIIPDTDNEIHQIQQIYSGFTSGVTYTTSIFAKAGEYSTLQIYMSSGAFKSTLYANFNLTSGTITSYDTSAEMIPSIIPIGNGWYRCSITVKAISTAEAVVVFLPYQGSNPGRASMSIGDGTSGIYIWGAQLEVGEYSTSYIKTDGSQVTRLADVSSSSSTTRSDDIAVIKGTAFSDFYRQSSGSVYANYAAPNAESSTKIALAMSNGTTTNWVLIGKSTSGRSTSEVYALGNAQVVLGSATDNLHGTTTFAYAENDFAAATNGLLDGVDNFGTVPRLSQLNIGNRPTGSRSINGHISRLAYWPTRLQNTTIQQLTK